ncbi:MAG: putative DNA binding domain-containing protein [Paludibacteraceae bacterium]|nr:putative DNA binding domain-containing protein [Paludibacteraceae bacterium]MBP9016882.1 putative DNA binding domain-containing protein [Paludibacteraceae bacterium]
MHEQQNIEFKSQWTDNILKTVCAFANTNGGTIYIGIDDNGNPVELKNIKKLMEDIPNKIKNTIGIVPKVNLVERGGKQLIEVNIESYKYPVSYKGAFYKRSGSTNTELAGTELTQFLLQKSGLVWDQSVEPMATLDDINLDTLDHFKRLSQKRLSSISTEDNPELLLEKLNLLRNGKLKRAAILLFGKNPRKFFITSYLQIGRFISESEVISSDIIDGNLFEQVEKALEILRIKYLQNRFYYEGIVRKEDLEIPEAVLREAIINALIHRDYMIPAQTQLRVYDDKIWLWNAGKLPEGISIEQLKKPHASYLRNPLLADIFYKAGYIESWGRGTLNIIDYCTSANLPEPEMSEEMNGFLLVIHKYGEGSEKIPETTQKSPRKVPEKSQKILNALKENPFLSRKQLALNLGESEHTIQSRLRKLQKEGIIKRIGTAKGGHWEVVE